MRLAEVVRRSSEYLRAHGVESPHATAETLLMNVLGVDRATLYARDEGLDAATARLYGRALCQRCTGTPLQYLTGEQQFMNLVLRVRPGVFVPRPETEVVVEAALGTLAATRDPVVVDVGTGTGAIGLAIKRHRPDAVVIATDVSEAAVAVARGNAERAGLDVDVRQGNLLDPVDPGLRGALTLIVSNPPYVTRSEYDDLPDEVKAEPYEALVGGTDLHRRLVEAAAEWLGPSGALVCEIGAAQGPEVASLFSTRLSSVEVLPDLTGRDRVVRGFVGRAASAFHP